MTGRQRGKICSSCNHVVGQYECDLYDPLGLLVTRQYLEQHDPDWVRGTYRHLVLALAMLLDERLLAGACGRRRTARG